MGISVVILAAGAGTRMKSTTPKVLHTICGKAMLFYSIDEALCLSDDVYIVLFHQFELIQNSVIKAYKEVYEQGKIHFHLQDCKHYPGTGGALMKGSRDSEDLKDLMSADSIQNPKESLACKYDEILILNGDMPLVRAHTLRVLCESKAQVVMSVLHLENPDGYGRVLIEDKRVKRIIEQKDASEEEKQLKSVNAGVYKFHKSILGTYLPQLQNSNSQQEFYLTDVVFYAQKNGIEICAIDVEGEEFMGVNSKLQLSQAQEVMLNRLRAQAMNEGVIMHLPHTIYLESGVRFEGECVIEQGVQILGECVIKDSHIKAHSVIEQSIIESSDVGPLAHIRPKSHLIGTHIGNFVETKSASLKGVKAGHLSYLGDCEVGEGSNIGAGVITCNYDGRKKHKTSIGQNVFVGSDVQLIAPVNIESNVLIGAGSTITKDAKEGDLVLSRTMQKNIPDGFYKMFPNKD